MKKKVYVGFKFSHMGPRAGYDLVKRHVNYDIFIDCQLGYEWQQKFSSQRTLLSKIYGRIFGGRLWWVEWQCLFLALFNKNLVFHFIYPENTYRYLGLFKWLGFKIVCTYHQPASFFSAHPEYLGGLRYVDDVIVLSDDSSRVFEDKMDKNHVHFIPHGVDSTFFCPNSSVSRHREILMVGNWMRNFSFADKVFNRLFQDDSDVVIHIITMKSNHKNFGAHPRLHLHSEISDQDLLLRYRSASLLFLSLNGFAANNAVLEAASVGCSILISSDQEPDKSAENLISYVPMNLDVAVRRVFKMLSEPNVINWTMREWVVQQFAWPVIGEKTQKILVE
ncbi:MAG: hypothetical protein ACRD5H_07115 [Nitrososphaerales archaeon]